jgi:hypothetical protein
MSLKPFLTLTAVAALATLLSAGSAFAQAGPPPAAPPEQAQKAPATSSVQGDLLAVDADAKTVTIQPASGADQVFKYTADTKVVGGDKGIAGLATMKGSRVTVTFRTEGKDRIATQIEVLPKAGN